jgi:hypothetical protein
MKLLDTDVLIEHLRGNDAARTIVTETTNRSEAACSVLTRFELLAGMRSNERHAIRSLLDVLINLEVTEEIATRAGEWARTYQQSHSSISAIDYLVAATAEVEGADLLTRNVRHFPMFPGLPPAL